MPRVTFYTRVSCHLCDEALAVVKAAQGQERFVLDIVDLDEDAPADKREAYDWEVPVVELDGRKIMKYTVDADRLIRLLRLAQPDGRAGQECYRKSSS